MDYDFWLRFYKNWEVDNLLVEIDTCHIYQQGQLRLVKMYPQNFNDYLRQLIQSQERVKIIVQAIKEKLEK